MSRSKGNFPSCGSFLCGQGWAGYTVTITVAEAGLYTFKVVDAAAGLYTVKVVVTAAGLYAITTGVPPVAFVWRSFSEDTIRKGENPSPVAQAAQKRTPQRIASAKAKYPLIMYEPRRNAIPKG